MYDRYYVLDVLYHFKINNSKIDDTRRVMKMNFKKKFKYVKMCFFINIKSLEIYGGDFIFGIISAFINCFANLSVLIFIYNLIPQIAGWPLDKILFIYGLNTIACSIWKFLFINTISLPYYLRDGEFDGFLVRPISPLFQIMMDGFDEDAGGELVLGNCILIYAWIKLKIPVLYIIGVPVFAISSALIYASISIILSTLSFYTISQADFANLTMDLQAFANYPITIYTKFMQILFSSVLPIGFIAFYPSIFFIATHPYKWLLLFIIPIISVAFYQFSKYVWTRFGLKHYESTGT